MPEQNFKLIISCPKSESVDAETRGSIMIDDEVVQQIKLSGTDTQTYEFTLDMEDGEHTISITHDYSADSSCALVVDKIEMDDIDLGVLAYNGTYKPIYPEPWYSDQVEAGTAPKEIIGEGEDGSACLFMGWEGKYSLTFTTPLYEWLLEQL